MQLSFFLRSLTLRAGAAFVLLAMQGCNLADGLQDVGSSLLSPGDTRVDVPGQQLFAGKYQGARWFLTSENVPFLLARTADEQAAVLKIYDPAKQTTCEVGPADGAFSISTQKHSSVVISYLKEEGSESVDYFFHDPQCEQLFPPLIAVQSSALSWSRGMLFHTAQQELLMLAEDGEFVSLMEEVARFEGRYRAPLWVLKTNGDLWRVPEEEEQQPLLITTEVSDFYANGDLFLAQREGEVLAETFAGVIPPLLDACVLSPAHSLFGAMTVEKPCASGKHYLAILEDLEEGWSLFPLSAEWAGARLLRDNIYNNERAFVLWKAEDSWGKLGVAHLAVDPNTLKVTEAALQQEMQVELFPDEIVCSADYCLSSPESGGGLYVPLNFYRMLEPTASEPSPWLSQVLAIDTNQSSCSGLLYLQGSAESAALKCHEDSALEALTLAQGTRLPVRDIDRLSLFNLLWRQYNNIDGEVHLGIVTEVNEQGGNLRDIKLSPELQPGGRILAENVQAYSVLPIPEFLAFAYLKAGTQQQLRVVLADSELDFEVHNHVSEYAAVVWPTPGLLYTVSEGEDAGVWFAKAR